MPVGRHATIISNDGFAIDTASGFAASYAVINPEPVRVPG
jgi:hypothetical protein